MKKTAILFLSLFTGMAFAQERLAPAPNVGEAPAKLVKPAPTPESVAVFWSEDFANGIPSDWAQAGTSQGSPSSSAVWEYRGPNTTPDITVGSRGAFATNIAPINSLTAANGFVVFDSDYLDNNGDPNNIGGGTAPAPHVGRLWTDTVDLSSETEVELKFDSYARRFFANFLVAFSTDGGATWPDTVEVHPETDFGTNGSSDNAETIQLNVSDLIGGAAQARVQFIFDGTPGNANGNGYYFWMIDDIELRDPPRNQLFFTGIEFPNGAVAPPRDVIYDPGSSEPYPKYGIMHSNQIVPIEFDANIYNYGTQTQSNVGLEVEIWDNTSGTPTLVTTVTSPVCSSLPSLDTCDFNTLTTNSWTPPATEASYLWVYKAISDSVPSGVTTTTDTVPFFVNDDVYSLDRTNIDNFVGSNSANPEITAMGITYNLKNEDPDSAGYGGVWVEGVDINLSSLTDSTADLEFAFYDDTSGFGFGGGGGLPVTAQPVVTPKVFTLDGSFPGTLAFFDLTEPDSMYSNQTQSWTPEPHPLELQTGTYLMIITFFPNAADGVIRIANDATFDQPDISSVMGLADGSWFGGFTSDIYEGPHIRLVTADPPPYDISLTEDDLNSFSVYPNPTNGVGNIEFANGGQYEIKMFDMIGNVVHTQSENVNANQSLSIDLNDLPAGVYLLNVEGEGISKTVKLTIQ